MMSKWSEEVADFLDDIEKDNRIAPRDQGVIPTELELLRLKIAILELEVDAKVQQDRLRDQFAMEALTGFCAPDDDWEDYETMAVHAYRVADAMLAARDK